MSTYWKTKDITLKKGGSYSAAAVGEVNVVSKMKETNAIIGGEGNGGVIFPKIICSRDSLTGIALILDLMATSNKDITSIIKDIPKYYMLKTKISCNSDKEVAKLLNNVKTKFKKAKLNLLDGVKVILKDSWIHIRASNTEPIVRIIAEGKSKNDVKKLVRSIS